MKKDELMKKYKSSGLNPEDTKILEQFIEDGIIDIEELEDLSHLHTRSAMLVPEPNESLRARFYNMLSEEKRKMIKPRIFDSILKFAIIPTWDKANFRLAFTLLILAIGIFVGRLIIPSGRYQNELADLNGELKQMKEMMMMSMLENSSATTRLKAVSISHEIGADSKVSLALLNTLSNDDNVNVRLAALEALEPYASVPEVREGLVRAIRSQQSALVLLSLAELMVRLQDKNAIKEFEILLQDEEVDPEVMAKIKENLEKII